MRLVADQVRGESMAKALAILNLVQRKLPDRLEKLLMSAISNWQAKNEVWILKKQLLFLKSAWMVEAC